MLDLRKKRDVTKLMAEKLEAWIDEAEECGDCFFSEVNTSEMNEQKKNKKWRKEYRRSTQM